jgi:hypothetical protein
MSDDLLTSIDEAFGASQREIAPRRGRVLSTLVAPDVEDARDDGATASDAGGSKLWDRTPWVELFVAVQFLWGALLFAPGAQSYRGYIRALPYLSSLGLLLLYLVRRSQAARPRSSALLMSALFLLVLNLLHPTSQLSAGLAQCVFQLSIAAPMFWAFKAVKSTRQLERLIVLMFVMNFASAGLGILQVYFPDRFLPSQFSLQLSESYLGTLSYVGNDGRMIIRPPGLSDIPGGASVAGGLTALLGLGLMLRRRTASQMLAILGAVAIGMAVIYLTQVRSVLLMVVGAAATLGFVAFRRGRVADGTRILGIGGALVVASFLWASSLGGAAVDERFLNIRQTGALRTYQENRGNFLAYTVSDLLDQFPFGAGVGRWGMMNTYFADPAAFRSAPIHVEIQLTGWLLDGGWPMWILYGSAIVLSLFAALSLTAARDPHLVDSALVVLAVQVFIAGMAMAGPVFNTQLGILFWLLTSAVQGASNGSDAQAEAWARASDQEPDEEAATGFVAR